MHAVGCRSTSSGAILGPLVAFLTAITSAVTRLFGADVATRGADHAPRSCA